MRHPLPFAIAFLLACTNDYDQFNVGGTSNQGAGPSGGAPTGAGPAGGAPSGAGPAGGAPSGGAPAGGMGGDGGTPVVGGMGGMGGMPVGGMGGQGGMGGAGGQGGGGIVNGIGCGNGVVCDVENGEFCCIPDGGGTVGTCKTSCLGNEAPIECDEPSDCGGGFCCADLSGGTQEVVCQGGPCSGGDIFLCSPGDECGPLTCMDATNLPDPIMTCQ